MPIFSTGTPQQFSKAVAAAATPERLSSIHRIFTTAIIIGSFGRAQNANTAWVGPTSGDGTQLYEIAPGERNFINSGHPGIKLDLYDFYVDVGADGEGVDVIYW